MAAKYILKKLKDPDNHFDTTDVIIRIETESLSDVVQGMEEFIRACGFCPEGTLDFVGEETTVSSSGLDNEEE